MSPYQVSAQSINKSTRITNKSTRITRLFKIEIEKLFQSIHKLTWISNGQDTDDILYDIDEAINKMSEMILDINFKFDGKSEYYGSYFNEEKKSTYLYPMDYRLTIFDDPYIN